MAPSAMQPPSRILVPVTDSEASLEAVSAACSLARARKSQVLALHVIEVLRSLPLNSPAEEKARRGEMILRRAEETATAADYHIGGELVQARQAGQAIVGEARDRSVGAIIMGIEYNRLSGAFQMGRTADYILRNAQCQVWIVRQALAPGELGPDTRR